jgi:SAM-dependent methyltransferase
VNKLNFVSQKGFTVIPRQQPLRFELSEEETERIAALRQTPIGKIGFLRLLARSPYMIPETARVAARGAREALAGGVFGSLVDAQRARLVVPDAAAGVGWYPPQDLLDTLLPMLRPDGDVLELGAGGGRVSRLIAPRVASLTCTDVSRPLLAEARHNLSAYLNVRTAWMNGFTLERIPDQGFDLVFAAGALGYVEASPTLGLFDEIRRVLRPQGALVYNSAVFDTPKEAKRMLAAAREAGPKARISGLVERPYCLAQIEAWMNAVGLELESPTVSDVRELPAERAVIVARRAEP